MLLVNVPNCQCGGPFSKVLAITDTGETYCTSCAKRETKERPHVANVPAEIKEIITALTTVANLRIHELRPIVKSSMFHNISDITIIKGRTNGNDGECMVAWGKQTFPLTGHIRPECNDPRGRKLDLRKLPMAITPELRDFLQLLKKHDFLVTQIVPSDRNTQRMYLERWYGPENVHPCQEHEKLILRIELALSMDIADGIRKAIGTLTSYVDRKHEPLPYAAEARGQLEASFEANFVLPSMCLDLLKAPLKYAVANLVTGRPEYLLDCIKLFPEMADVAQEAAERAKHLPGEGGIRMSCEEEDAMLLVCRYADYHLATIRDRIKLVVDGSESSEVGQDSSNKRPKSLGELDPSRSTAAYAKPHFDHIEALYSLFLRIPAEVIRLEAMRRP